MTCLLEFPLLRLASSSVLSSACQAGRPAGQVVLAGREAEGEAELGGMYRLAPLLQPCCTCCCWRRGNLQTPVSHDYLCGMCSAIIHHLAMTSLYSTPASGQVFPNWEVLSWSHAPKKVPVPLPPP